MEFTYRGLRATAQRHIVTDEEIDRQLQRLLQQSPRYIPVTDRPSQAGDEVVLDYAGFCNGKQFAGGTAKNQTLVLGSGTFIPGFEDQLIGKLPGEEVTVTVTFPQQYHAAELAGQPAEFRCTIHQIRQRSTYQLDDTFAKEVGDCDNLAQLRQKLGESMQAYADEQGEMELQDQLLRQAAATLDITIDPKELEAEMDAQLNNLKAQLSQQGLTIEMYCSFMGTTPEKLREESRPAAENAIRCRAAIDRIVLLEALTATDEEIAQTLALICRRNRMTMEQLRPYYDEKLEKAVIQSVLTTKVMELIRSAAIID